MTRLNAQHPRALVLARFVEDLATLSKCEDKKVAAIVTNHDGSQIFSIGINGGPKRGPQCLCHLGGKYTCIHAEANAIAKDKSYEDDKAIFITLGPCPTCAALIANSGISQVFYLKEWKDNTGLKLLQELGIRCFHVKNYRKEQDNG